MPARSELAREAVQRMDQLGLRSQLVALDSPTLIDLVLRLNDRNAKVTDAHKWLNEQLGGTEDEPVVDDNAVYRFADHARRLYGQVRAEHARRIARLTVAHATDDNIRSMTRVAQGRLVELTAEKLVEADSFDDLGKAANAAMFAVKFAQESDLSQSEHERKVRETEAKLELAETRKRTLEQKLSELPDKVKALQSRIDELSKRVQKQEYIDPSVFQQIRDELAGLADVPEGEAA